MIRAHIPAMGNQLKFLREQRGWTHDEAAKRFGMSRSGFIKIERGERKLTDSYIQRASEVFGVSQAEVLGEPDSQQEPTKVVPIAGKAGAGPDGSVLFARSDEELGEADAPINATAATKALQVEGTSMRGIAEDGSLIFYDDREPPNENHIGELCICWLEDDRVLVKYPYPKPGSLWDLESTTATTLRDVPVRYFAHVTSIVPRRAARTLIRKNANLHPIDTVITR